MGRSFFKWVFINSLVSFFSCLFACDCDDGGYTQLPKPVEQIDIIKQRSSARVDILWVIDDSSSMKTEQKKLTKRFLPFLKELLISSVDFHIGVISTDVRAGGVLRAYNGPAVPGCLDCRTVTSAIACPQPETPWNDALSESENTRLLQEQCPAAAVFKNLIESSTGGSGFEQGFTAISLALGISVDSQGVIQKGHIPIENEAFLRDDAALFIIFVADEDEGDKIQGDPVLYTSRMLQNFKSRGNENLVKVSAITGYPLDASVPLEAVCPVLRTSFNTNQNDDDVSLNTLLTILQDRSVGCVDQSEPESRRQEPSAFAETGSRYVELACRNQGIIANICETDYLEALQSLGADAAGLIRKFALSLSSRLNAGPDCTALTMDDTPLDCDGNGSTSDSMDAVICVKATLLGETEKRLVPRDERNGWIWEPSTSSIRFAGNAVPAPGTDVEIRYRTLRDGDPICEGGVR